MSDAFSSDEETPWSSVDKICEFLEQREITLDVIHNFRKEKMDVEAIENCADETLINMGLTKVGDRLALTGFCTHAIENKTRNRKRGLLEAFLKTKKKTKSSKSSKKDINPEMKEKEKNKQKKKSTKKIQLGWLHFDEMKKKFVSVRLIKGGGTRDVDVPITCTREDILELALKLFFPDGCSEFAGEASNMDFRLANFKNEKIESTLHVGEAELPFTLTNYIRAYQTNKVRLYLTSSLKDKDPSTKKESGGDSALLSTHDDVTTIEKGIINDGCEPNEEASMEASISQIIEEQNLAFDQSLECDRAKSEALEREISHLHQKEVLRIERSLRIPCEPNLESDDYVTIKVRHLTLGLLTRRFPPMITMGSVFDWVGSLSPEPEFFKLCLPCGPALSGNELVSKADRQTLSMVEADVNDSHQDTSNSADVTQYLWNAEVPIDGETTTSMPSTVLNQQQNWMEPVTDDVVSDIVTSINAIARGVESHSNENDDMYSIMTIAETSDDNETLFSTDREVPIGDESPIHTLPSTTGSYNSRHERTLRIRRATVMNDLIRGNDEMGLDLKGIYRDAISCFWQEFYNKCTIGERERVPALRHDFQLNEWTAVARIVIKGYWDLGYFPVMLSEAFLVGVIFGETQIGQDILLQSFNRYLAKDEEVVVCQALRESDISEEFIELLDRFECRKIATKENAKALVLEIAHKEIVQKTQYVADCWMVVLQTGFHDSKLSSKEGLHQIFHDVKPTNKKVIEMIRHTMTHLSGGEQETLKYLKCFVRGMEMTQLKSFLMCVTGSDIICVESITIEFSKLQGLERRPIAHTCGCVLELPSTYDSYTEFRAEFSNILAKEKWQNDIM